MANKSYKTDVLIIGGGIAGITAALELVDTGLKILIVDRDTEHNLGGLAKESFGGIFFVDSPNQRRLGIKDSPDLALSDWFSAAEYDDDDHLPKKWAEAFVNHTTSEVYNWLRGQGIGFFPVVHWVERGMFKPGNSVPRFHMVWGTGHELAVKLIGNLRKQASSELLDFKFRHRITRLLYQNNRVSGAEGLDETSEHPFQVEATHTIIAAGGVGGSEEFVRKNWYKPWGAPPEKILNGAHEFGQGDLHMAAEKLDASVTHMDLMWNYAAGIHHPFPKKPNHGLSVVPPKSALWVNYQGDRIGPNPLVAGYDTRYLVKKICGEKEKYTWQIMNWKIANKEMAVSGSEYNDAIKNKSWLGFIATILFGNKGLMKVLKNDCIDFVTANSLGELVEKMNALNGDNKVSLEKISKTVSDYDRMIDRGSKYFNDEQLRRIAHLRQYRGDKLRTCKFQKIDDPKAYPLVAIREFILARKTLGGIQTDLDCQVLRSDGSVINGLFAVGEAAGFGGGGIHGKGALEGTFLGTCIYTARVAAKNIKN